MITLNYAFDDVGSADLTREKVSNHPDCGATVGVDIDWEFPAYVDPNTGEPDARIWNGLSIDAADRATVTTSLRSVCASTGSR